MCLYSLEINNQNSKNRDTFQAVAVVAEAVVEVDRVAEEAAVVVHEEVQAVVASLPPGEVDRNPPPHGEVEAPLDRAVTVHLEALMDRMGPVEARIVVPITDHREDRIAIDIMETPTSLCERTLTTGSMAGHARTCRYRSFWGGDGYGGGYITRSGPTLSGTAPVKQQAPSESPTITTKTIREVLFPHGVPSKEVFDFEVSIFSPMFLGIQENTSETIIIGQWVSSTVWRGW